jgi:hypothetical protein
VLWRLRYKLNLRDLAEMFLASFDPPGACALETPDPTAEHT